MQKINNSNDSNIFRNTGFILNISSFATLGLSTLLIPIILPVLEYAKITYYYSLIGLTFVIFTEPVQQFLIKEIDDTKDLSKARDTVIRAFLEYFLISLVLSVIIYFYQLNASQTLFSTNNTFFILSLNNFIACLYITFFSLAISIGAKNLVARCTIIQGSLSFILPIIFYYLKIPIILSILFTYIIVCFDLVSNTNLMINKKISTNNILIKKISINNIFNSKSIFLDRSLIYYFLTPIYRILIIYLPIYLFTFQGSPNLIASYKIVVSSIFGSILLLPFNRNICFYLIEKDNLKTFLKISFRSIALSGIFLLFWKIYAYDILSLIFGSKYFYLNNFINSLSFFLPFLVLLDFGYVLLLGNKKFIQIIFSSLIGFIIALTCFLCTSNIIFSLFILISFSAIIFLIFIFKLSLIDKQEIMFAILLTLIPSIHFFFKGQIIPFAIAYCFLIILIIIKKRCLFLQ